MIKNSMIRMKKMILPCQVTERCYERGQWPKSQKKNPKMRVSTASSAVASVETRAILTHQKRHPKKRESRKEDKLIELIVRSALFTLKTLGRDIGTSLCQSS